MFFRHAGLFVVCSLLLLGCHDGEGDADGGAGGGTSATGGGTAQSGGGAGQTGGGSTATGGGGSTGGGAQTGGGSTTGGGAASGGGSNTGGGGACVPASCDTLGCGVFPDGCGAMVTCTATCECTEQNFDAACPSRPCMTLAGCVDFKCHYETVSCGLSDGGTAACGPTPSCSGAGCGVVCTDDGGCDDKLFACGGGICAGVEQYCDPSPAVMNGVVVYQNQCVAPPKQGCGTCGLGTQACDTTSDRFTCAPLPIPVEDAGVVECDSTVAGSTFVYLDPAYTGTEDGSRMRPFSTFGAAATAANSRGARGIVIGGQVTFTEPLVVSNGVSIYGGFGVSPAFVPDASKRPLWNIPATALDTANNRLVGASASNITLSTIVRHVEVRTANVNANDGVNGASNLAFLAVNAPALQLDDVVLSAGDAGRGVDGTAGATGTNGGNGSGRNPGTVSCGGTPVTCTLPAGQIPARQVGNACGLGGKDQVFSGSPTGSAGSPGTTTGSVSGGGLGTTVYDNSNCNLNPSLVTVGGPGATGSAGTPGSDGAAGTRRSVSASGVISGGRGTVGTPGSVGTFAGGGGAGGSFEDGCMNGPEWGGPGGGGGAPGCGGLRGELGGAGGMSIGLIAASSPGLSLTSSVQIHVGAGGAGGDGGAGGNGGTGGDGESSAICPNTNGNNNWRGKCGGRGGKGGAGGRGGHAGGSAGGDSVGVYCTGATSVPTTGVTIQTGTAGPGGNAATPALRGVSGTAVNTQGC